MYKVIFYISIFIISLISIKSSAQNDDVKYGKTVFNGKIYNTMIMGNDTIIVANLDTVSISSMRSFTSDELKLYRKYKYYAAKAYPYAKDAINILNTIEERTKDMKPKQRKKYIDKTYKQLEANFKIQLKGLSKTQGKIMIKMIEKETGEPFYDLVKRMRNGFVAFYWNQFGKFYDYDLKEGYIRGNDKVLDTVLQDFKFDNIDSSTLNAKLLDK
ncbi:MAG: DUF4294 domain-containing protein [Saprospiraceae bacterium]